MNFLLRPHNHVSASEATAMTEPSGDTRHASKASSASLESLTSEDPFPQCSVEENSEAESESVGGENGGVLNACNVVADNHSHVSNHQGWITIPYKELPDDWSNAPDISSLKSLDRSFVFPGEQVHILACLSATKEDVEIITPFKVAEVMSKNGKKHSPNKSNSNGKDGESLVTEDGSVSPDGRVVGENGNGLQNDISASEWYLRMEVHKKQTESLLQRFKNSHFFVRIAESGEPLWSKRSSPDKIETHGTEKTESRLNAFIDKGGNIDANFAGGAARNSVKCCPLPNGDIVVLLQVNIGVNFLRDPIIEVLQFEKFQEKIISPELKDNSNSINHDPCGELLKWLLPLDNTIPPPSRTLSPPRVPSSPGVSGAPQNQKPTSSGSQLFSHFRSYSMSSLPQNIAPPAQPIKTHSTKTSFDPEDYGQYSYQKAWKGQNTTVDGFLSFRGVTLERERFSVRCGLEGIYIPGRRWRRKVELVQPVEIHSFAADCNTDDLICVQIKNVSPEHVPDIVVYIDALSIVFEEASKGGPPSSLPIACIEAGNDHCLPNLALRRGEEHSFILKPVSPVRKNVKVHGQKASGLSRLPLAPKSSEGGKSASNGDQYAIMVSCRCNYTESRLFFKQPTSWRPRIHRDLLISVTSEVSHESSGPNVSELPVQVLTLQASNLTSEDLTLTVLAPASFTSPPSVGSLSSPPATPISPFVSVLDPRREKQNAAMQRFSSAPSATENQKQNVDSGVRSHSFNEQASPISDAVPSTGFSCSHLWLQSRVPLGCVPAQSTATIKLELLPLTDGIITLDTLKIDIKEKGITYIPEHSLKINATSSVTTGIV